MTTRWHTVEDFKNALESNPLYVDYRLATPQTIELGSISMPSILSGSAVYVDAEVTPTIAISMPTDTDSNSPIFIGFDVVSANRDRSMWVVTAGKNNKDLSLSIGDKRYELKYDPNIKQYKVE